jgi:hypothetical protein
MSEPFDDFADEPSQAEATHAQRLAQAQHDAQAGSNDLFEALSALEQVLSGARQTQRAIDDDAPARTALTAWRGNTVLVQHTLARLRRSAATLHDALGTLILG